ncbi:hypothetical protein M0R45_025682 [Rubus argutus]|uniref:Uncharacterized protein n=1 Tax=Rubus argutus TaxID=59490 RepID=A0AAW1WVC4_RUBAR
METRAERELIYLIRRERIDRNPSMGELDLCAQILKENWENWKNSTIGGAGNGIDDDYGAKRDAGAITASAVVCGSGGHPSAASIGGQRSTYGRRVLARCDFVALQVNGISRDERETEMGSGSREREA